MSILTSLKRLLNQAFPFDPKVNQRTLETAPRTASAYSGVDMGHIESQSKNGPPFYCGTAFCGHSTITAAKKCWQKKCDEMKTFNERFVQLLNNNDPEGLKDLERDTAHFFPERNPANWPCNRSSADLQREYVERAKSERYL